MELVDKGVCEASHIFCELALIGANMKHIDIGGGLGVDYDGSNSSTSEASIGYGLEEYAEQVVNFVKVACFLKNVKCPIITCESGRGLVLHQSVLVFDVLSAGAKPCKTAEDIGIPLTIEGLPYEMAAVHQIRHQIVPESRPAVICDICLLDGTRLLRNPPGPSVA